MKSFGWVLIAELMGDEGCLFSGSELFFPFWFLEGLEDRFGGGDFSFEVSELSLLRLGGSDDIGLGVPGFYRAAKFGDVVEESDHLVVVLLRERVVFVIVAAGTAHGETEPNGAGGVDAINGIFEEEFFDD